MPTVSYMRLDGSVPPGSRHGIVSKFNHDPSIDVLLLTTKGTVRDLLFWCWIWIIVGGLGLNLTGADTVIFMEHDWNPQMDLQAMDRAHRIGQKKTVNVYRLITRNTVEEKIMSLQRFKLNIANTLVTTDNSSMNTMSTGQILDLFSLQRSKRLSLYIPKNNVLVHQQTQRNQRNKRARAKESIWSMNLANCGTSASMMKSSKLTNSLRNLKTNLYKISFIHLTYKMSCYYM